MNMNNETCCIDGCEAPGILHANHENASLYCTMHGHCRGCERSVEYFVFVAEIGNHGAWICPCVASARREIVKQPAGPFKYIEEKKTIRDVWVA